MDTDKLYFKSYTPLKEGEIEKLAADLRSKDMSLRENARKRMVAGNLGLVVSIAQRFGGYGGPEDFMDRVQDGNLGLIIAVDKYEPSLGKFSTYSTWWIKNYMRRGIFERRSAVHLPEPLVNFRRRMHRAREKFYSENGREASDEEIVEILDCRINGYNSKKENLLEIIRRINNVENFIFASSVSEDSHTEETMESSERSSVLNQALNRLKPKHVDVLKNRYGLDNGKKGVLKEISETIGCTKEGVRLIEKRALKKLRKELDKTLK